MLQCFDDGGGAAQSTMWVANEDGSLSELSYPAGMTAPPVAGLGRVICEEEYTRLLGEMQARREANQKAAQAAEVQARASDYFALLEVAIPDAVARRLSGYDGPAVSSPPLGDDS